MTSLCNDVAQSTEPRCVCRDINTTSQMWQHDRISYCTPQSAPLTRGAAARRLLYSTVPTTPLLQFDTDTAAAISTEHTPASDELQSVTLISSEVTGCRRFQFNDEQIDCICDVLRQSDDVDRLRQFLGGLTRDQLHRDSEQLYKVDHIHVAGCDSRLFHVIDISLKVLT